MSQFTPAPSTVKPTLSTKAVVILALGVASVLLRGPGVATAIVALLLVPSARREIAASNGTLTGGRLLLLGFWLSWFVIAIALVVALFMLYVRSW